MRTTVTIYLAPSSRRVKYSHSCQDENNNDPPSVRRRTIALIAALLIFLMSAILCQTLLSPQSSANTVYISPRNDSLGAATVNDTDILSSTSQISVIRFTQTVTAGDTVTLKIRGEPNTLYSITLHLSNSVSSNSALIPKRSDHSGTVEWSWRVSNSTSTGTYMLIVCSHISDSERVCRLTSYSQLQLTVLPKSS